MANPGTDGDGTGGPPANAPAGPSLHYTATKPPKLEVGLGTCNIRQWKKGVKRYARARGLMSVYSGNQGNIHPDRFEILTTELEGIIEESIPKEVFVAGLSQDVTDLPPHQAIPAVEAFCSRLVTPGMLEQLRQDAEEIKIERDEALDDYIQRHCEHRMKMVNLGAPGAAEPQYVLTILRGLETRPSLSSQVAWLQGMNFQTIFDLHMQLRQTVPTQDRLWKNRSRGRGRRGGRGRGRGGRGGSQLYDTQDNQSEAAPSASTRGSGRRGRGGRGRGKGHANAVMAPTEPSEAASQAGDDDESDTYEVNGQFHSYIDFVVDSACYPSFLRVNRAPQANRATGHATVADGRTVPVQDMIDVCMATEDGYQFKVNRVCKAHFARNLLSVAQILDAGIRLLFRPSDVLFLKPNKNGPAKVVARARRRRNDFIIPLKIISRATSRDMSADKSSHQPSDQSNCKKISTTDAASPTDQSALAVRSQEEPTSQDPQTTPLSPTTQEPAPEPPKPDKRASPQTTLFRDPHQQTALPALVSRNQSSAPTAAPKPQTKPYLPRARNQSTTNAIPYPSHLPKVSQKEQQLINEYYEWHCRLNHEPLPQIQKLARDPASGLPPSMRAKPPAMTCMGCNKGHHSPSAHKSSAARPPIAHTIAVDLIGPMAKTAEGHQHMLIATELHSRMHIAVPLN